MTDVIAGRFALCDPIARGGSGVVWRAYDRKVEQFCAAKVMRRRDAGDLLRFVHEQSVRLRHRHLLTPYSWAAEDAYVVLASELVDGGSVGALIARHGSLSEQTVTTVLDQLLQALEHVHAAGLVHRDVTPANVLLRATRTGPVQTMLADFGLATGEQAPRLTRTGVVVGTPGYLPPEVFRGATPHPRHDLYAAGQLASALVTGIEPTEIVRDGALAEPYAPVLPPGRLADTIAALTALDPDRRLDSASSARALLAATRAERAPRTREGQVVMVTVVLRALTGAELDDARDGPTDEPVAAGITPAGTPIDAISAASAPTTTLASAPPVSRSVSLPDRAGRPLNRTVEPAEVVPDEILDETLDETLDEIPHEISGRRPTSLLTGAPPRSTALLDAGPPPPDHRFEIEPGIGTEQDRDGVTDSATDRGTDHVGGLGSHRRAAPPPYEGRRRAGYVEPPRDTRPKLPTVNLSPRAMHRAAVIAASGLAAAVIVIPTALMLAPGHRAAHARRPATPPSTAPVGADGVVVRLGGSCSWQEQGNQVTTLAGKNLLCTGSAGGYHWTAG